MRSFFFGFCACVRWWCCVVLGWKVRWNEMGWDGMGQGLGKSEERKGERVGIKGYEEFGPLVSSRISCLLFTGPLSPIQHHSNSIQSSIKSIHTSLPRLSSAINASPLHQQHTPSQCPSAPLPSWPLRRPPRHRSHGSRSRGPATCVDSEDTPHRATTLH